jgi:hypothetical protein
MPHSLADHAETDDLVAHFQALDRHSQPGEASFIVTGSCSDRYVRTSVGSHMASRYFTAISVFEETGGLDESSVPAQVFDRMVSEATGLPS